MEKVFRDIGNSGHLIEVGNSVEGSNNVKEP